MMAAHPKSLCNYRGTFNYKHEIVIRYAWATSGRQAKNYMMRRLAKEHGVHPSHVFALFDGNKPNFNIEVDPEWKNKIDHQ